MEGIGEWSVCSIRVNRQLSRQGVGPGMGAVWTVMKCYTAIWDRTSGGVCEHGNGPSGRGEFRPRQTRQLPRAVDLKGRLLSCQSY